ncbi:hypothetical protein C1H46_018262 [Malus baccata]|uniref:Uncharacterized protein n=1 Tax=Malus baccata TaxID=106549 RepID=A0A540MCE6_MALBA|nr:hypothetical protein C1H46_018262 [Malus baccata]
MLTRLLSCLPASTSASSSPRLHPSVTPITPPPDHHRPSDDRRSNADDIKSRLPSPAQPRSRGEASFKCIRIDSGCQVGLSVRSIRRDRNPLSLSSSSLKVRREALVLLCEIIGEFSLLQLRVRLVGHVLRSMQNFLLLVMLCCWPKRFVMLVKG